MKVRAKRVKWLPSSVSAAREASEPSQSGCPFLVEAEPAHGERTGNATNSLARQKRYPTDSSTLPAGSSVIPSA